MSYMRGTHYVYTNGDEMVLNEDRLPIDVFDELVVMRYAQLAADGIAFPIEERALKKWGPNFGCSELAAKHGLSERYGHPVACQEGESPHEPLVIDKERSMIVRTHHSGASAPRVPASYLKGRRVTP